MISLCTIVKNEERWIEGFIEHLKPIVAEFIIIDTGSTDKTAEKARALGARVTSTPWEGDFAKGRNLSLGKATQKWILIMDPDERIAKRDLQKLLALTESKDVMAYAFQTRNYSRNEQASGFRPCAKEYDEEEEYSGYFESRKVRLFRNVPTIRFVGSVHELVEPTIQGKIVDSDIPVHHYGSTDQIQTEKSKPSFYKAQSAKKAAENPSDWKAHFEMGVERIAAKEYGKAVQALEKSRKLNPRELLVLSNLGYAYMETGRYREADEVLQACLKIDAKYHDALLNLGVVRMREEKWAEAIQIFAKLVKIHPHSFLAFRNMGISFGHLRKFRDAARAFEVALKIFPQFHDARVDLGLVCFAAGRPDIAKPILEEALKLTPQSLRARAVLDDVIKALKSSPTKKAK